MLNGAMYSRQPIVQHEVKIHKENLVKVELSIDLGISTPILGLSEGLNFLLFSA